MTGYKEIFGHRWSETGVILRDGSVLTPCLDCYDALITEVKRRVKNSLLSRQS